MNITENEKDVLEAFVEDDFISDFGWESPEAVCWVEALPHGLKPSTFSGVMGSLAKKGLIETDGEAMSLTDAGRVELGKIVNTFE